VASEKEVLACYRDAFSAAIPADNRYEFFPSEEEMYLYYKMATQGMVYRCLMLNFFLSGLSPEACRAQLCTMVTRTTLAIIDHGLHISLCIGRTNNEQPSGASSGDPSGQLSSSLLAELARAQPDGSVGPAREHEHGHEHCGACCAGGKHSH
jgi:hypothetical protein